MKVRLWFECGGFSGSWCGVNGGGSSVVCRWRWKKQREIWWLLVVDGGEEKKRGKGELYVWSGVFLVLFWLENVSLSGGFGDERDKGRERRATDMMKENRE
ncbi:hypothetical protein HAX54_039116 [Datura stramonium]|uniref:Transmembrane protein n=1 Tax=Datura stramonium TaxID=4076 RepID=A0ABS8VKR1_DATST|nr:hypothetical protein [Datura stramonium]